MISSLIDRYKNYKKKSLLNQFSGQKGTYAFVGVGNHSVSNLYPIIDFFGISPKYICTKTTQNASLMAKKYGCVGTCDFQEVLTDTEIKGVFISTAPTAHFALTKQALQAHKNVFVEKPPCLNSNELQELIQLQGNAKVVVGLQKRYASVITQLKTHAKKPFSYNYKYLTGAYPEGDAIWDLFIHPLDVAVFLFGKVQQVNATSVRGTIFLQVTHENKVVGSIELSTDYTWDTAKEEIVVNSPKGTFESNGAFELTFTPKSPVVLGVPLEKVIKKAPVQQLLVHNNGFVPVMETNSLTMQGYAKEVKTFIDLCEGKDTQNYSDLKDLVDTFSFIELVKTSLLKQKNG